MNILNMNSIKSLAKAGRLRWTKHVVMRLLQRDISQLDIEYCLQNGEIIEIYEGSYPYPSYLIYGITTDNKILHTVVGFDENYLWVITAYYPNNEEWENDF